MASVLKKALPKKRKTVHLKWEGSKNDLMEIVYCLYLSGKLVNSLGLKATLYETSEAVFGLFELESPKNPSRLLTSLRERKKPGEHSIFFEALCRMYPGFFRCIK